VRALVTGTAAVIGLYLLINGAFLYTLGYPRLATSEAVATEAVATVFPTVGARLVSALICISALGAVNGLIFTGARITYALGDNHRLFRRLGYWSPRTGTPVPALALQGLIAMSLVLILGNVVDAILYTAAAVYTFYLGTSFSILVLRFKEPGTERPYRVTGYPVTPLIFSAVCAFLVYKALIYAAANKQLFLIIMAATLAVGIIIYVLTDVRRARLAQGPAELGPREKFPEIAE